MTTRLRSYCQPAGDIIDWGKDGLPQLDPCEVAEYLEGSKKGTILDVRELHELSMVAVESHSYEHISMLSILDNQEPIPDDLGTEENPAFVLCLKGIRSQTIGNLMASQGRTHVANIRGGVVNWKKWEATKA